MEDRKRGKKKERTRKGKVMDKVKKGEVGDEKEASKVKNPENRRATWLLWGMGSWLWMMV